MATARPDVAMVDNRWGRLYWFANPDRPADGHWKQHVITTKCPHAYDVVLVRLSMETATSMRHPQDFASGQINWYENPGKQGLDEEWTHHMIDEEMKEDCSDHRRG